MVTVLLRLGTGRRLHLGRSEFPERRCGPATRAGFRLDYASQKFIYSHLTTVITIHDSHFMDYRPRFPFCLKQPTFAIAVHVSYLRSSLRLLSYALISRFQGCPSTMAVLVRLFYHFTLHPITCEPHHRRLRSLMSHANPTTSSSPNFYLIFNNALEAYKKRTKNDLLAHPLVIQLQDCTSSNAVLALIHQQVPALQRDDDRLTKWLDPTVRVLHAFSETLGGGVSLVGSRK